MRLLRHFGSSRNLIYTKNSANSFVSPTSKKIARKCFLSPTYAKTGGGTSNQMIFANAPLRLSNPGGYNRLENLALNFVLSTVNCKPAFLTPAFTTTSINIVGAPTFWFLRAAKGSPKNRSEDRPLHRKECGPPRNPIRGANNAPQKDGPYIRKRKNRAKARPLQRQTHEPRENPVRTKAGRDCSRPFGDCRDLRFGAPEARRVALRYRGDGITPDRRRALRRLALRLVRWTAPRKWPRRRRSPASGRST
jgi:hypothetical protein